MPSSLVTQEAGHRSRRSASRPVRADRLGLAHVAEHRRRLDPGPGALGHGGALVGQPRADAVGAAVVDGDEQGEAVAPGERAQQARERHDALRPAGPHDDALALDRREQVERAGDDQPGHPQQRHDDDRGEDERDVLDEVGLIGEVVDDAEQRRRRGRSSSRNRCRAMSPAPTTRPMSEHQRRVAAVAGTERVAHAHDVPLAGGVAPGQAVVLGHDRQLVGGPLGETEGGGVGEGPAGAVGGARRRALEPPRLHPRPHAQPVLGPHQPALRRALGARADALEQPPGDERGWRWRRRRRCARDGSESATASSLAAAHRRATTAGRRARSVTIGGPTARTSQRRLIGAGGGRRRTTDSVKRRHQRRGRRRPAISTPAPETPVSVPAVSLWTWLSTCCS